MVLPKKDPELAESVPEGDDLGLDVMKLTPEEIYRRRERARLLALLLLDFLRMKN